MQDSGIRKRARSKVNSALIEFHLLFPARALATRNGGHVRMAKVGTVRKEVGCRAGMRALGVYMRQSGLLALSLVALMLGATRGNASSGANGEREATQEPAFVVVIDAGSSGSRVHVFQLQWNVELGKTPSLPEVKLPAHKLKIEPGLSTYAHRPRDAGASILPLIDFAERHVPQVVWAQTPLLLLLKVPPHPRKWTLQALLKLLPVLQLPLSRLQVLHLP